MRFTQWQYSLSLSGVGFKEFFMEKFLKQASYILAVSAIVFISCKKDQQPIMRPAAQQSLSVRKIDTVFQYTATNNGSSSPVIQTQKDFYIPTLDSVNSTRLKVFRALNSTVFQEVYPYPPQTISPYYVRAKGKITYSEL